MPQDLIVQFVLNALIAGSLFALFGLSFGIIYSTSKILHFAHGAVYICCAYLFLVIYVTLDWSLWAAVAGTLVGAAGLGYGVMRFFYAPMLQRRTSSAVVMIASLGLFIVTENLIVLAFGNDSQVLSKAAVQRGIPIGPAFVTPLQIVTLGSAISVFGAVYLIVTRSRLGRALRGIADDSSIAEIIGIDVPKLRQVVFAIGSVTLAVAAILNSLDIGVAPGMGLSVVLVAAVAAIIGGASSIFAGIAGGFLVGAVQSLGILWIDPRWQNLIIFSALVLILIFRPAGLFASDR